jgi:hypothetical protein
VYGGAARGHDGRDECDGEEKRGRSGEGREIGGSTP